MADAMDTKGKNIFKEKYENFKNLDQNQKTIILAAFALVISTLVVLTFWFNRVEYKVLYSNLPAKEAAKITKYLQEKKIPFKLQDQGATVLVPSEKVHQTRLELAGEGLPKSGEIGFEIFDKTDFQSSEFAENVKYVRALQGELSASINKLEAVEESKINLSIPRSRIYMDEDERPSASVVLKIRPGYQLSDDEVRGIAHLVSGCIEGMKVEDVSIMSTDGKLLSEFLQEGVAGATSYQLKVQKEIQKNLEKNINTLVTQVLGQGKAIVKATIELKQDNKEIRKTLYTPAKENVGVVRSTQTQMEDYKEKDAIAPAAPTPNPTGTPAPAPAAPAIAQGGKPVYGQRSQVTNYEVSKTEESERVLPGQIKRISLGVMIDDSTNLTEEQVKSLTEVIASSAGIDKARGDLLTVRLIKFQKEKTLPSTETAGGADVLKQYQKYLIPAMAPLLLLIFAALMLGRKKARKKEEAEEKTQIIETESVKPLGETIDIMAEESATDVFPGAPMGDAFGGKFDVRETIRRLARENPKMAARIIEQMIHEEAR
ncbi:MAG: flagellar M-ring protein FliF [Firmicutes bacterium]|nr:flagellar M-ring protein FliF [Bacillota bacterium]